MRRLLSSLSAIGFLVAVIGCDHTAGVCDCDANTYGCGGCCGNCGTAPTSFGCCPGAGHLAPVPGSMVPNGVVAPKVVEPIKEMPKEKQPEKEPDL